MDYVYEIRGSISITGSLTREISEYEIVSRRGKEIMCRSGLITRHLTELAFDRCMAENGRIRFYTTLKKDVPKYCREVDAYLGDFVSKAMKNLDAANSTLSETWEIKKQKNRKKSDE